MVFCRDGGCEDKNKSGLVISTLYKSKSVYCAERLKRSLSDGKQNNANSAAGSLHSDTARIGYRDNECSCSCVVLNCYGCSSSYAVC